MAAMDRHGFRATAHLQRMSCREYHEVIAAETNETGNGWALGDHNQG
jgi:hypothetical protein